MQANIRVMHKLGGLAALLFVMITFTACSGGSYGGSSSGAAAPPPPAPAKSDSGSSGNSDSKPAPTQPPTTAKQPVGTPLTAGVIDDNAAYSDYLSYANNYQGPMERLDLNNRRFVTVVDAQGQPIADAQVNIGPNAQEIASQAIYRARTGSDGRVAFFAPPSRDAQSTRLAVSAERDGVTSYTPLNMDMAEQNVTTVLTLAVESKLDGLDIVFLLDSTGSMGDEIDRIKATIYSIGDRINGLNDVPPLRLALITYRDRGDSYISKAWDFSDVQTFAHNLDGIAAGGGGDYPEDFRAGLDDTIHKLSWTPDQRHALRLVFAVTDAAPHEDYSGEPALAELAQQSTELGLRVFPIGASGLDANGEYAYRQLAVTTLGKFVFLTYENGSSGAPGKSTNLQVSQYSTANLDDLIVRLISAEVANQQGHFRKAAQQPQPLAQTQPRQPSAPNLLPIYLYVFTNIIAILFIAMLPFLVGFLLISRWLQAKRRRTAQLADLIAQPHPTLPTHSRIATPDFWATTLPDAGVKVEQYRG